MPEEQTLTPPIRFGTDGWRGVIAAEFTFDRLALVAPVAAQVMAETFGDQSAQPNLIIVGYDRRFLSPEFAQSVADAVSQAGFDVLLANGYAPTPAFSWAAFEQKALGALVITASHNPAIYSGLKIKGAFGGSVAPELTKQVEARVNNPAKFPQPEQRSPGKITSFDPWQSYCAALRTKVDIDLIREQIRSGELTVFADVMHGAAATGLERILQVGEKSGASGSIHELNTIADPLFGGGAPEPLPRYMERLLAQIKEFHRQNPEKLSVGLVFDGDADRIAAVDSAGNFLSTQILIPILISHLAQNRGFSGELIKTISGADLMPRVAALYDLPTYETPVGYKYIAERMLELKAQGNPPMIGGEESGGVGYGNHIPERDALLSALYVLEAIATAKQDLSDLYQNLRDKTDYHSEYDRIDKRLSSLEIKDKLMAYLSANPLDEVAGRKVVAIDSRDGFKFRLADQSWLLVRFSGTEPVLRLYCEAATMELVQETLSWISDWVEKF
ncbi:phosphoglucomutase/phosphomannomutase alpha/beta/alpha domain I [Thalassoporum mexicanum PCC 7367]|uniref:phosphoglucomutase/phosphomannomutase family protein n=1 Tax=Thalassoporum mexicanum TaxID=3457544 RepID=UPI00029FBAC7|nr:phosphoglucomutase/phosphomannomutase family protein [Pseudanabaena sp. PCC 7367]AFY69162.1 phosphoglucomutase/phosphomannomutase alpha/beta/alpha domain I [Pseudanabaena sp. PCC 7367]